MLAKMRTYKEAAQARLGTPLSKREMEVLTLAMDGKSSKEIGRELNLASGSILEYQKKILQRLGARNMMQAVVKALRQEIISL